MTQNGKFQVFSLKNHFPVEKNSFQAAKGPRLGNFV
jgi:hypothetical protein